MSVYLHTVFFYRKTTFGKKKKQNESEFCTLGTLRLRFLVILIVAVRSLCLISTHADGVLLAANATKSIIQKLREKNTTVVTAKAAIAVTSCTFATVIVATAQISSWKTIQTVIFCALTIPTIALNAH